MQTKARQLPDVLSRLWRWFRLGWSAEVPENVALCEFDCRKNECTYGEWASCERRISKAAGELMPLRGVCEPEKVDASSINREVRISEPEIPLAGGHVPG
jgi:hypothetical protein